MGVVLSSELSETGKGGVVPLDLQPGGLPGGDYLETGIAAEGCQGRRKRAPIEGARQCAQKHAEEDRHQRPQLAQPLPVPGLPSA